jgi:hypothetical protein
MVKKDGQTATCSYCGEEGKTFTIEQMADVMEAMFKEHFYRTPTEPSGFEAAMMKEDGGDWDREGDSVDTVIADRAEVDEKISKDIQEVLGDRHYDLEGGQMGEEGPFDDTAQYAEAAVDDRKHLENWSRFENSLKTRARFYSQEMQDLLTSIFGDLAEHRTPKGQSVIVKAGPATMLPALYRARVFQADQKLEEAIKRPDTELGPPPWRSAVAGRMNARGISVFYGATDLEIALAEVRPPVGSRVLVGQFNLIRPLNLLNLEALRSVNVKGSLFDRGFIRRLEKAKFLGSLSHLMTAPIMPDDEPFDYLATQVIADFLAAGTNPQIDGIIYPSTQGGGRKPNVVLFHKAARVKPLDIPPGTKISASLYSYDEDGMTSDYWVFEERPKAKKSSKKSELDMSPFSSDLPGTSGSGNGDERADSLEIDVASLEVHEVHAVSFNTQAQRVRRNKTEKQA